MSALEELEAAGLDHAQIDYFIGALAVQFDTRSWVPVEAWSNAIIAAKGFHP